MTVSCVYLYTRLYGTRLFVVPHFILVSLSVLFTKLRLCIFVSFVAGVKLPIAANSYWGFVKPHWLKPTS